MQLSVRRKGGVCIRGNFGENLEHSLSSNRLGLVYSSADYYLCLPLRAWSRAPGNYILNVTMIHACDTSSHTCKSLSFGNGVILAILHTWFTSPPFNIIHAGAPHLMFMYVMYASYILFSFIGLPVVGSKCSSSNSSSRNKACISFS